MKVGSIGYATHQGLGILLKDFYDNGIVTDVVTMKHWKYINYNWYRGPSTSLRNIDNNLLFDFAKTMDVMFFFETTFCSGLIEHCREENTRTILMPMYECTPKDLPTDLIDLILNPSMLDQQHYSSGKFVSVPVPRYVKWKLRKQANTFVHNAGHLGLNGRNGTQELLVAMQFVESPIKLIVRSQEPIIFPPGMKRDDRIEVRIGTVDSNQLYEEGDVFIFPEKFNGLSLPLQEAKASGMLVMGCNRFPINTWTNTDPLIPVVREREVRILNNVMAAVVDPRDIATTIDNWYGRDITEYSLEGRVFHETHSWNSLKDTYFNEVLSCVI